MKGRAKSPRVKHSDSSVIEQRPTHTEIEQRAYSIYLNRGASDGWDVEDWLQAEDELQKAHLLRQSPLAPATKTKPAGRPVSRGEQQVQRKPVRTSGTAAAKKRQ